METISNKTNRSYRLFIIQINDAHQNMHLAVNTGGLCSVNISKLFVHVNNTCYHSKSVSRNIVMVGVTLI